MRSLPLVVFLLAISSCLFRCGQKEDPSVLQKEADSLLKQVSQLQMKLGSPEIQRLHDFENEINEDITMLAGSEDTSVLKYLDLYNGLGQCMETCNQFHEEAFLLESSVRMILEKSNEEDPDKEKIRELLSFEQSIYLDLSSRVDSSLGLIMEQVEMFYRLKPEIEALKQSRQKEQEE